MKLSWTVATLVILACGSLGAGETPRIEDSMRVEGQIDRCARILVLGITDDAVLRREFEDRFVSHLKARGVDGLPSWKLAEGLGQSADKERILIALTESRLDGVLTVRPVPLRKDDDPAVWASSWKTAWDRPMTIRQLIDETLPLPEEKKVKRTGAEITLWEVATRGRLWSGRTSVHSPREIRKGVADLVQQTIDALMDAGAI